MTDNPILIALFLILAGGVLTAAWSVWLFRPAPSKFLPPQRRRAVPWSGWEILAAYLVSLLAVLIPLSFVPRTPGDTPLIRPEDMVVQMLGSAVGFLAAIGIVRFVSQTRPYQLGLSTHRLGTNVFLGVFAVLCLSPLVMGVFLGIAEFMQQLKIPTEEHPITQLGKSHPSVLEWVLMALNVTLAAPLLEELIARGLLQRWLATRSDGWKIAIVAALFFSLFTRLGKIQSALKPAFDWHELLAQMQTTGFVLATIPLFLLLRRYLSSSALGAIYGSSIVFAAAHAFAWPSPIPLFLLAIGLGMLAYRTQSLVPSIVAHSLFNTLNFVYLILVTVKKS